MARTGTPTHPPDALTIDGHGLSEQLWEIPAAQLPLGPFAASLWEENSLYVDVVARGWPTADDPVERRAQVKASMRLIQGGKS